MTLPNGVMMAKAVVACRLAGIRREYPTLEYMARMLRDNGGMVTVLYEEDLTYLHDHGLWGTIPSIDPMIGLIGGLRQLKKLKKAGLQLTLEYNRDPNLPNGLYFALAE